MPRHPLVLAITLGKPGGATTFVFRFARWLKARGEDVVILVGEEGAWLEDRCREAGIPLRRVPHLRREIHPWHDLLAVGAFRAALRDLKPRALQLNSSKAGVVGSLAGRLEDVPNITYCIGGWAALEASSPWKRAAYLWPERLSAGLKDTIVCLHPGDTAFAQAKGIRPRRRLEIIPNGIDRAVLERDFLPRAEARRRLGLPADGPVFGTVANFYPAKALPAYLEACARVAKAIPEAVYCLVGDGPERPAIETKLHSLGLQGRVLLAGTQEEAARLLRAFDVFVLPSKKEGMPFAILEAMVAGLPIVATNVGANRWMAPEAAIVPAKDARALADSMVKAMRETRPPSYEMDLARFDEERCFAQHLRVLEGQGQEQARGPVATTGNPIPAKKACG